VMSFVMVFSLVFLFPALTAGEPFSKTRSPVSSCSDRDPC
jgi:hypothetical protein